MADKRYSCLVIILIKSGQNIKKDLQRYKQLMEGGSSTTGAECFSKVKVGIAPR